MLIIQTTVRIYAQDAQKLVLPAIYIFACDLLFIQWLNVAASEFYVSRRSSRSKRVGGNFSQNAKRKARTSSPASPDCTHSVSSDSLITRQFSALCSPSVAAIASALRDCLFNT